MRNSIIATLLLLTACSHTKNLENADANAADNKSNANAENVHYDTIPLRQIDGSSITLLGIGTPPLAYTETIDGYTVVLGKDAIYEYAKQAGDGDLVSSGVKAHNPQRRDAKEIKYVAKKEKHLRYKSPKLNVIMSKHNKLNTTPKKEKK